MLFHLRLHAFDKSVQFSKNHLWNVVFSNLKVLARDKCVDIFLLFVCVRVRLDGMFGLLA